MRYLANAKINISLKVLNKRDDGYHNIEFVMAPISLYDEIDIYKAPQLEVKCDQVDFEDNLVTKMVHLIENTYQLKLNYAINITKHIPIGGGLGGGSSDAICVLKAINELEQLQLSTEEMINLAKQIGCDCPFFVHNQLSYITGIGENVYVLENNLKDCKVLIINPHIFVSTKKVFANLDLNNYNDDTFFRNDLATSCFTLYPEVKAVDQFLQTLKQPYLLSGSGSCFLMFLFDTNNYQPIIDKIQKHGLEVYECTII